MSITFIYGIRAIAAVSLLSAMIMIFISTYVFVVRIEDLMSSKFPASDVPLNASTFPDTNPEESERYETLLQGMNGMWTKYRSVLVSSSMLATMAGLLQCIFSGLVLLADTKSSRLYVRKWGMIHLILTFVLLIIILNTAVLTENRTDKTTWDDLIQDFKYFMDKNRPRSDYSELYRFLGVNQYFIYVGVGIDLAVIFILMGVMLYMLKYLQDYEPCE